MKPQLDKGDGRILLGDNTSGETFMLWPIMFQRTGLWISTGLRSTYTYTADRTCWPIQFRLAQNTTCARPSGTYLVCKVRKACVPLLWLTSVSSAEVLRTGPGHVSTFIKHHPYVVKTNEAQ